MRIAINIIPLRYVIVHLFSINCYRGSFGHAPCNTNKVIHTIITIQIEADHARKPSQKDFRDNHHDYNLVQQGFFVQRKKLFGTFIMEQLNIFKFIPDVLWDKTENESRQKNNGTLVKNVNHDIGNKL